MIGTRVRWMCVCTALVVALTAPATAADRRFDIDIAAKPLAAALHELARATGMNVLSTAAAIARVRSRAVQGLFTPIEAARRMIAGTSLEIVTDAGGALIIRPATNAAPREVPARRRAGENGSFHRHSPGWSGTARESTVEDIVVTAQRRAENLQDAPVAVTALGAEYLRSRQIQSVDGLSGLAPNLLITPGPTNSTSTVISIRGSATANTGNLFDPTVGIFLDGVYLGKSYGSIFDINDIERAEILRGPQGTLFGRDTLAGAIVLTTRRPGPDLRVEAEASYGNYDARQLKMLVNLPLTDRLFLKVATQILLREGFTPLVSVPQGSARPVVVGHADDRNRRSAQVQLRWQPTDHLTIDYSLNLSRIREHPLTTFEGFGPGGGAVPPGAGLPDLSSYVRVFGTRPDEVSSDAGFKDNSNVEGHTLTASLELGSATLTSITGYRNVRFDTSPDDVDGTPIIVAIGGYDSRYHQFSEEMQAIGSFAGERVRYVGGLYYFADRWFNFNPQKYFFGSFDTRQGGGTRSFSAYAQTDLRIDRRLSLSFGLRYTHERKNLTRFYQVLDYRGSGPLPPSIDITPDDDVHADFDDVSPVAIASYSLGETASAYIKYAVGYRSGGFNGAITSAALLGQITTPYKPEKNNSIELGFKSDIFERRVRIGLALFDNIEINKQVPTFTASEGGTSTIVRNAARAHNRGVELEIRARPTPALSLGLSIGRIFHQYSRFCEVPAPQFIVAGDSCGGVAGAVNVADDRRIEFSPRLTAGANAGLILPLSERRRLNLGIDANYHGSYASNAAYYDDRFPYLIVGPKIPSLFIANAQMTLSIDRAEGGAFYSSLWIKNIMDTTKIVSELDFGPSFGYFRDGNYNPPRQFGITLGVKL